MKKHLSKLLALAMAVTLTTGVLASCTQAKTPNSSSNPSSSIADTTKDTTKDVPQTLQLAVVPEGNADRIEGGWQNKSMQSNLMFRTLFLAETNLTDVQPDLAKEYKISDDGLVYTITLNDGDQWSDGQPITANDVAFSIKLNMKAAISNGIYISAFANIKGAQAYKDGGADVEGIKVDGNTITLTLDDPYASFIPVLAQFEIVPEHILKDADPLEFHNSDYWKSPICSGMFMLDEISVGNFYTLKPNEKYSGTAPKINKVVVTFVADYITAAQNNQLDYISTNATDQINEFKKLPQMSQHPVDILFYRYFIANMKGVDGNENAVMQDVRIREAVMHAIDRESLAVSLFPETATLVNSGILMDMSENNGKGYDYDPEKAKALLKEANYDFNRTFRILYYYKDQTSVDFMEAIAQYLTDIGLKVEITQSSQGTVDLMQTRNYDIGYKGLSAFTIAEWYGEYQSTNANFKNIFGGDTQFDELITKLGSETDGAKRSAILKELQELENKNLYKLPLYTLGQSIFVNSAHVKLPDGVEFPNPWYKANIDFENWEIIG